MLGGAIRVSTPFMFVALGECLTEKSGRINLGLEGNLVLGAMVAYAVSYLTGSPGSACSPPAAPGSCSARMHGYICKLPKVNDIAVGIAMMSFGTGLAFFFGKPYIQPHARRASTPSRSATGPAIRRWRRRCRSIRCSSSASSLAVVHVVGASRNTRWGLIVRMTGDSAASARAMGVSVDLVRFLATAAGGFLAGIGGAFLSLYYPGIWNQGLSLRPGPDGGGAGDLRALGPDRAASVAALLFGAAGAIGPSLQSVGITQGYYFFNAAPYILTLFIMIASARSKGAAREVPGELRSPNERRR